MYTVLTSILGKTAVVLSAHSDKSSRRTRTSAGSPTEVSILEENAESQGPCTPVYRVLLDFTAFYSLDVY